MIEQGGPLIDYDAVDRLRAQPLDWRYKGLPPHAASVGDLIGRRVPVDGFTSPVAVLDGPALTGNLDRYAAFCVERGLAFAPHVKTTMAPALAAEQARRGAWAFTVANVAQARVLRAFGARRILIAHGVVDAAAVDWLVAAQDDAEVYCWVDSPAAVTALDGRATADRPVPVFVELGLPGGRTGARGVTAAAEVARAVEKAPGLRLAGITGYEGSYGHDRSAGSVSAVRRHLDELVRLADAVDAEIVTAGGSAYPDLVAEAFAGLGCGRRAVLRSGAYVAHDDGHYAGVSPFALRPALRVWATVVSVPEPGLAFLNMGKRDVSYDLGLPVPLAVLRRGERRPVERLTVTALNDQHAYLSDPDGEVEVGDWVACGISHPCTMFERWPALPVVDSDDRVTDLVRTFF
ncbi:MAG TPA: alanine racemase [Planosporangium sp.]|jgi:D-serine deaminase-like pyridoxal phosphate-dependent protein|nr:alanine racemase [Planosporangium sp.]